MEIQGKFNHAVVFTETAEEEALNQIKELCNQESMKESVIRIMPDTHAGNGCVIGSVMSITDKVIPNLVGVDIGCGMIVSIFNEETIDFEKLDNVIRENVPSGFSVRSTTHKFYNKIDVQNLKCWEHIENKERVELSIGTLGGGNHFIEVSTFKNEKALIVHTGSRNLGKQVCDYYQKIAIELHPEVPKDLAYLDGEHTKNYLHDMEICQRYAAKNREAIIKEINEKMGWESKELFSTIHNYIDTKNGILRKGAISAEIGEKVIIPINMRDGSIIAVGKGNSSWLFSAPHGAGRIMSRGQARRSIDMNDYEKSMEGIWTSCVSEKTIDESPMTYKPIAEILENIRDTVTVCEIIKPLYNYKAN